eukprot:Nk52_evm7s291 gene=Nk52_evmTU7s291
MENNHKSTHCHSSVYDSTCHSQISTSYLPPWNTIVGRFLHWVRRTPDRVCVEVWNGHDQVCNANGHCSSGNSSDKKSNQSPQPQLGFEGIFSEADCEVKAVEASNQGFSIKGIDRLTYGELDLLSDQAAEYLCNSHGVSKRDYVAIFLERNLDLIVWTLAAIKAGATYVPLDCSVHRERLEYILGDCKPAVVVSVEKFKNVLEGKCSGRLVLIDCEKGLTTKGDVVVDTAAKVGKSKSLPTGHQVMGSSVLAVVYTSGSTGKPKGVLISQANIVRLLDEKRFCFGSNKKMGLTANLGFDATLFEVWGSLLCGGCLSIVSMKTVLDPLEFKRWLYGGMIDLALITPALFDMLSHCLPEMFAKMECLCVGGDVFNPNSVLRILECGAGFPKKVLNLYGPTENGVVSTIYEIDCAQSSKNVWEGCQKWNISFQEAAKKVLPWAHKVPIGTATWGTSVFVWDNESHKVLEDIGTEGELVVGGIGVAIGYLGRETLTKERFVSPNALGICGSEVNMGEGGVLYLTGDRVCIGERKNLIFMGRLDDQVKVNGFRVEIGEIECILNSCPGIEQLCAKAFSYLGSERSEKHIVAYYKSGSHVSSNNLKTYAHKHLPEYMIPSFFVEMDNFTLTDNGKIDKKILSDPYDPSSSRLENINPYKKGTLLYEFVAAALEAGERASVELFDGMQISFRELHSKSDNFAKYLIREGIEIGNGVGVVMEQTFECIIQIVGAVKAGCYYVPLDPSLPPKRLVTIVENANVRKVLVSLTYVDFVRHILERGISKEFGHREMYIVFNNIELSFDSSLISLPSRASNQDAVLALLYTSGTTGTPKGVKIMQKNIVRVACDQTGVKYRKMKDRQIAVANFGFDASLMEIWCTICTGNTVVFCSHDTLLDPSLLALFLKERNITRMFVTAALFDKLVGARSEIFEPLFWLATGGDVVSPKSVRKVLDNGCPKEFRSVYGPTENGVFTTTFDCKLLGNASRVPIGKPLLQTTCQVWDTENACFISSPGARGELVVGGDGVCGGYWNNPTANQKAFMKPSSGNEPHECLYRTGDVVDIAEDGNYMFVGRVDNQVKIRGFRIELEEIESVAKECEGVATCVCTVVVPDPSASEKKLALYFESERSFALSESAVMSHLRMHLPAYMMPSFLVNVGNFKLTPNGKIDRTKLPSPCASNGGKGSEEQRWGTEIEKYLARTMADLIFRPCEVFEFSKSFLENGGDSLSSIQLIARVKSRFGVRVCIKDVLGSSSLSSLAAIIEDKCHHSIERGADMNIVSREKKFDVWCPLSPSQEMLYIFDKLNHCSVYNVPMKIQFCGYVDTDILLCAVKNVLNNHVAFKTMFMDIDGIPMQKVFENVDFPVEIVDVSDIGMRNSTRLCILENLKKELERVVFDLGEVPLLKMKFVIFPHLKAELYFTVHHIVFDGWSVDVLMNHIEQEYATLMQKTKIGQSTTLKTKSKTKSPVDFVDYCKAVSSHKEDWRPSGNLGSAEFSFWKEYLNGIKPLELPLDFTRPKQKSYEGNTLTCEIPFPLFDQLKRRARELKSTTFAVLLAIYALMLYKYTNMKDVMVGGPLANRQFEEVEDMVGLFVNPLPYRVKLDPSESFKTLVERVTKDAIRVYEHQSTPISVLLDLVYKEGNMPSLFQTFFIVQNGVELCGKLDGDCAWSAWVLDNHTSKFDLGVFVYLHSDELVEVQFEYDTDLFEKETIERMKGHLLSLIHCCTANVDMCVGDFTMLAETERHLLTKWSYPRLLNEAESVPMEHTTVFGALCEFSKCVRENFIAMKTAYKKVHCFEILRLSEIIAEKIITLEGETKVKCCKAAYLQVGFGMYDLIRLLALSRLGLPVFLFRDSPSEFPESHFGESVLVCARSISCCGPEAKACFVEFESINNLSSPNEQKIGELLSTMFPVEASLSTSPFCYCMSESTVVQVSHQDILELKNISIEFPPHSCEGTASFAPPSSAAHVFNIFSCIWAGITLCFTESYSAILDANLCTDFLLCEKVATVITPPTLLSRLLAKMPTLFSKLTGLLVTFEGHNVTMACSIYEKYFECIPKNSYSAWSLLPRLPFATSHRLSDHDYWGSQILLGTPGSNVGTFVLDEQMDLSPIGVKGRLFVCKKECQTLEMPIVDRNVLQCLELIDTGIIAVWSDGGKLYLSEKSSFNVQPNKEGIFSHVVANCMKQFDFILEIVVVPVVDVIDQSEYADGELKSLDTKAVLYYSVKDHTDVEDAHSRLKAYIQENSSSLIIPSGIFLVGGFAIDNNGVIDRRLLPKLTRELVIPNKSLLSPLEQQLVLLWSELLRVDKELISLSDSFFALGGHSISLARMIFEVKKRFKCELGFEEFISAPYIRQLADIIAKRKKDIFSQKTVSVCKNEERKKAEEDLNLNSTVWPVLDEKGNFAAIENLYEARKILLTGGSGFVGIHILNEVILKTNAIVFCFLRNGSNGLTGFDKLIYGAEKFGLNDLLCVLNECRDQNSVNQHQRIVIIDGNLAAGGLGLSVDLFDMLCEEVDAVYHCGAHVNHVLDYASLRSVNVLSTLELLRIATTVKNKAFYFVSTVSAACSYGNTSKDIPDCTSNKMPIDGYSQTKWICEQILDEVGKRGLPCAVIRLGNVVGTEVRGVTNASMNHLLLLVKGCLQLNAFPMWNLRIEMSPVDVIASEIVGLPANMHGKWNGLFVLNLLNPASISWEEYVRGIVPKEKRNALKFIPFPDWKARYLGNLSEDNAFFSLSILYLSEEERSGSDEPPPVQDMKDSKDFSKSNSPFPEDYTHILTSTRCYLNNTNFWKQT